MAEKIRGKEVWWESEKGNVAVVYSTFDLGMKYHMYRRVRDDSGRAIGWRFVEAFEFPSDAMNYFQKTPDLPALVC